ncbi:MAG: hypothetical protein LIP01_08990 [Tannerellaceae bacterium]|nr:hypothetical protein [Tannerellaceae bacterium]
MDTEIFYNQPDSKNVFTVVEQMPQFPGGDAMMLKYLSGNIKFSLPVKPCFVSFVIRFIVEPNGSLSDIIVPRLHILFPDDYYEETENEIEQQLIRLIKEMPDWEPGLQDCKPCRVYYTLSSHFHVDCRE